MSSLVNSVPGEFGAPISMEHHTLGNFPTQCVSHFQRLGDQEGSYAWVHRPAQNPSGMRIGDCRQVQPALTGAQVGDVDKSRRG